MAKLRITLKDPDGIWNSLDRAGIEPTDVDDSEFSDVFDKFVEYDEYVKIELDSETGEARVIPKRGE